jgi:hypothetical protein
MDAIIEEALRTILNEAVNETSVTPETEIPNRVTEVPPAESEPFRLRQPIQDVSMVTLPIIEDNFLNVLSGLQNHLDDYHRNIRLYQQNVSQMNRMYQNIIQSAAPPPIRRQTRQTRGSGQNFTNNLIRFSGMYPQGRLIEFRIPSEIPIPRTREIEETTENFIYLPSLELNSRTCPITLEEFTDGEELTRIRFCRHVFKKNALLNWFSINSHCPVCRYDILSRIV